jgi:hypothetical protein
MTAIFEITTLIRNHMYIVTGWHGFGVIEIEDRAHQGRPPAGIPG